MIHFIFGLSPLIYSLIYAHCIYHKLFCINNSFYNSWYKTLSYSLFYRPWAWMWESGYYYQKFLHILLILVCTYPSCRKGTKHLPEYNCRSAYNHSCLLYMLTFRLQIKYILLLTSCQPFFKFMKNTLQKRLQYDLI